MSKPADRDDVDLGATTERVRAARRQRRHGAKEQPKFRLADRVPSRGQRGDPACACPPCPAQMGLVSGDRSHPVLDEREGSRGAPRVGDERENTAVLGHSIGIATAGSTAITARSVRNRSDPPTSRTSTTYNAPSRW